MLNWGAAHIYYWGVIADGFEIWGVLVKALWYGSLWILEPKNWQTSGVPNLNGNVICRMGWCTFFLFFFSLF